MHLQAPDGFDITTYLDDLLTVDIPVILRAREVVEVVFDDISSDDLSMVMTDFDRDKLYDYSISRVGGKYGIYCHAMICVAHSHTGLVVNSLKYFRKSAGWEHMIVDGEFVERPREPDPDWL